MLGFGSLLPLKCVEGTLARKIGQRQDGGTPYSLEEDEGEREREMRCIDFLAFLLNRLSRCMHARDSVDHSRTPGLQLRYHVPRDLKPFESFREWGMLTWGSALASKQRAATKCRGNGSLDFCQRRPLNETSDWMTSHAHKGDEGLNCNDRTNSITTKRIKALDGELLLDKNEREIERERRDGSCLGQCPGPSLRGKGVQQ